MSSSNRARSSSGARPGSRSNKPTSSSNPVNRPSSKGMSNSSQEKRQIVGQYMLGKTIGEGTFGKVKLAIHIPTGEKSRIKEQADVRRVNREIKILKKARHGNIIQLYEVLDTQHTIYLIMECAEGGEMFDYIVAQKHVAEVQACKFFHQLIDGVEVLHKNEITHRDLKPENLLLKASPDGLLVKIVDFGLSNTHEGNKLLITACGSPCYAAPEMIAGKKYHGPLADLWSIGVILFALVCGFLPFEDPNTSVLYKKILSGDYKPPKWISADVRDLIACILEVDPRKRYTIEDIRKHPWYTMVPESSIPKETVNVYETDATRAETLAALTAAGLDPQAVMDGVVSHACNSLTAMYYLLEQKHRTQRLRQQAEQQQALAQQIKPNNSNISNASQRSAPETTMNEIKAAPVVNAYAKPVGAAPATGVALGGVVNSMGAAPVQPVPSPKAPHKVANNPTNIAPYLQTPAIMQQHYHGSAKQQQPVSTNPVSNFPSHANNGTAAMPSLEHYMKTGLGALPANLANAIGTPPIVDSNMLPPVDPAVAVAAVTSGGLVVPKLKLPAPAKGAAGVVDGHKAVHFRNTVTSIPAGNTVTSQTVRVAGSGNSDPTAPRIVTLPNSARAVLVTENARVITTINNQSVESDVPVKVSEELLSMMAIVGGEETGERPNTRRSHLRSRGDEPRGVLQSHQMDQEAIGSLNLDDMSPSQQRAVQQQPVALKAVPIILTTNMNSVLPPTKLSPDVKTGSGLGAVQQPHQQPQQQQQPFFLNAQAPEMPPRSASGGRRGKNLTTTASSQQPQPRPNATNSGFAVEPVAPSSGSGGGGGTMNPRAQAMKNKLAAQGTAVL